MSAGPTVSSACQQWFLPFVSYMTLTALQTQEKWRERANENKKLLEQNKDEALKCFKAAHADSFMLKTIQMDQTQRYWHPFFF